MRDNPPPCGRVTRPRAGERAWRWPRCWPGAAALRFAGIDGQSYWFDEAVTVRIVDGSLGRVFELLPESESTPPLYYVLAWLWGKVAGLGEVGLRSFSALLGVGVVAAGWVIGRLASPRVAIYAAVLLAANPLLVWYSQEARAYELLALLGSLSLLATLRFADAPSRGRAAAWAIAGVAALLAHYFAVFLVVAEVALLFWRLPSARATVAAAAAAPLVTAAALAPLARLQEADGRTEWISATPLIDRGAEVLRELATANTSPIVATAPQPSSWAWLIALPAVAAAVLGLRRVEAGRPRTIALSAAAVSGIGVGLPFLLGATPADFFYDRNLVAAWPAAMVALAAGLAALGRVGAAALAAVAAAGVVATVQVATDAARQRDDWRGVAELVGSPERPRALLVRPQYGISPLRVYGREAGPAVPGVGVEEIVVVGEGIRRDRYPPRFGKFVLSEARRVQRMGLLRYRAPALERLAASTIAAAGGGLYFEPSGAGRRWFARAAAARAALDRAADGQPGRLGDVVGDRPRLVGVPPEIPGAPRLRRTWAVVLDAAASLLESPSPAARARLAKTLGALDG